MLDRAVDEGGGNTEDNHGPERRQRLDQHQQKEQRRNDQYFPQNNQQTDKKADGEALQSFGCGSYDLGTVALEVKRIGHAEVTGQQLPSQSDLCSKDEAEERTVKEHQIAAFEHKDAYQPESDGDDHRLRLANIEKG